MSISVKDGIAALEAAQKANDAVRTALKVLGDETAKFRIHTASSIATRLIIETGGRHRVVNISHDSRWGDDLYTAIVMTVSELGGLMKLQEHVTERVSPAGTTIPPMPTSTAGNLGGTK